MRGDDLYAARVDDTCGGKGSQNLRDAITGEQPDL
jgi:hypothetical protein